ncbi:MAG: hypothetical protein DI598_17330 [Pseudopedobacter saltans]|uniref:Glycosyl transferase family 1 domain-containing protein n=1 Tax=Pseudopedobacter saltans TaxID=151895 RepID=A0A2W5GFK9_9SPHI|nr:MAG: hypothetical protein DI598_17330 [Pseudopedobacter saltans]
MLPVDSTMYLKVSFIDRLKFYLKHKKKFRKIFCFANVPPPIRLEGKVITYFHSFMLDLPIGTSLKVKFVLILKRWIIKLLKQNTDFWFVQSSNMEKLVIDKLKVKKEIIFKFPFYKPLAPKVQVSRQQGSFIYMSNGYEHKNHNRLLDAWEVIFANGYNVPLTLTIKDRFKDLNDRVKKLQKSGYNIYNNGWVDDVETILTKNQFQIYPSLTESFGLGLVEAIECGCEVIASNMDYVKSIITPIEYIDPYSIENIVETVLKLKDRPLENKLESRVNIKNELTSMLKEILK